MEFKGNIMTASGSRGDYHIFVFIIVEVVNFGNGTVTLSHHKTKRISTESNWFCKHQQDSSFQILLFQFKNQKTF